MPNPSHDPPGSSKAPNQDLKDMDVLCTFKIKIESQNSEYGCTEDQWPYPNQYQDAKPQSGTSSVLQAPNEDYKDMGVLCTFTIKIESRNLEHGCITDQLTYPNQNQDPKDKPGTSSLLQSPKWGLKGHGCSLHLQNQFKETIFGTWVYPRPVIILKSRSRWQTLVMNLHPPPKPQIRT